MKKFKATILAFSMVLSSAVTFLNSSAKAGNNPTSISLTKTEQNNDSVTIHVAGTPGTQLKVNGFTSQQVSNAMRTKTLPIPDDSSTICSYQFEDKDTLVLCLSGFNVFTVELFDLDGSSKVHFLTTANALKPTVYINPSNPAELRLIVSPAHLFLHFSQTQRTSRTDPAARLQQLFEVTVKDETGYKVTLAPTSYGWGNGTYSLTSRDSFSATPDSTILDFNKSDTTLKALVDPPFNTVKFKLVNLLRKLEPLPDNTTSRSQPQPEPWLNIGSGTLAQGSSVQPPHPSGYYSSNLSLKGLETVALYSHFRDMSTVFGAIPELGEVADASNWYGWCNAQPADVPPVGHLPVQHCCVHRSRYGATIIQHAPKPKLYVAHWRCMTPCLRVSAEADGLKILLVPTEQFSTLHLITRSEVDGSSGAEGGPPCNEIYSVRCTDKTGRDVPVVFTGNQGRAGVWEVPPRDLAESASSFVPITIRVSPDLRSEHIIIPSIYDKVLEWQYTIPPQLLKSLQPKQT